MAMVLVVCGTFLDEEVPEFAPSGYRLLMLSDQLDVIQHILSDFGLARFLGGFEVE